MTFHLSKHLKSIKVQLRNDWLNMLELQQTSTNLDDIRNAEAKHMKGWLIPSYFVRFSATNPVLLFQSCSKFENWFQSRNAMNRIELSQALNCISTAYLPASVGWNPPGQVRGSAHLMSSWANGDTVHVDSIVKNQQEATSARNTNCSYMLKTC